MQGHVSIYQGPRLVASAANAIHQDLYNYLFERLTAGTDKGLQNLFEELLPQAEAQGQDGIIYNDLDSGNWFAVRTTFLTPPGSNSKRLNGFFIPEAAITIPQFRLGYQLADPLSVAGGFDTRYATFAPAEPLSFFPNVPVSIVWQITVDR